MMTTITNDIDISVVEKSYKLALLGRPKELILMKLFFLFAKVVVGRAYLLAFVFFLLSLLGQSVLVRLEVDLVKEGSDALRFEGCRRGLASLPVQVLVLAWTHVAHRTNLELAASFLSESGPDRALHLVSLLLLIFF